MTIKSGLKTLTAKKEAKSCGIWIKLCRRFGICGHTVMGQRIKDIKAERIWQADIIILPQIRLFAKSTFLFFINQKRSNSVDILLFINSISSVWGVMISILLSRKGAL